MAPGAVGRVMRCRRVIALLAASLVALGVAPASVSGESLLWTLVASPLAATTGVQTTFTLTATNTDPAAVLLSESEIGCIFVDVPSNFAIGGAAVTGSNAGGGWHIDAITGNRVKVHTDSGGERLETFDWVRFTITATASSTGSLAWASRAYRDQNCGGTGALLGVPPIVVVTGPAITPTPAPTPTPVPTPPPPAPTPRPTATPALPLPIPLPSVPDPIPSVPVPSIGLPPLGATPTPAPTPRIGDPTPRATASATPATGVEQLSPPAAPGTDVGLLPGSPSSGGGGGAVPQGLTTTVLDRGAPRVDFDPAELQIHFETAGLLDGTTVWLVPTATFAIPALLLFLFVALQAVGALAWVPAVRRLGGRDDEVA